MADERRNLKVDDELFECLKARKEAANLTYPQLLREMVDAYDDRDTTGEKAPALSDYREVVREEVRRGIAEAMG